MKTTVEISDGLLKEAKEFAAREGTTVRALIESGLRDQLEKAKKPFKLRDGSFKGEGLQAQWRDASWQSIINESYESRGG